MMMVRIIAAVWCGLLGVHELVVVLVDLLDRNLQINLIQIQPRTSQYLLPILPFILRKVILMMSD